MTIAPYSGITFWIFLILFVSTHSVLKITGSVPWFRNAFMICVSILIIGLAQANHQYLIFLLLLLTILSYFAGKAILNSSSEGIKRKINLSIIVLVVFILCYFKYSEFQRFMDSFFYDFGSLLYESSQHIEKHMFFLGVSYFSFKYISFFMDCYSNKIKNLNLLTFINYILFFPNFFGGPINRYNFFADNIYYEKGLSSNYTCGLKRIINGLFKKVVLANNLLPFSIVSLDFSDPSVTPFQAVIGVYVYMFYIYFDFSGYTDMAIGAGKLVGIDLPENFNYPFFKRNLQQFWANWHMSLTTWLTDYIYWPLARKMRHVKNLKKKPVTTSNICIIITFVICGIWHGDGVNFFIWGTYHGIGLAILNGYSFFVRKYSSKKYKQFVAKSRLSYAISNFITFQFVAFGFLLFGCNISKLRMILKFYYS